MVPLVWVDENGQPLPTRPCALCGAVLPVRCYGLDPLTRIGWEPFAEVSYVNWCGHRQKFVTLPQAEGWWGLVPVFGEAA